MLRVIIIFTISTIFFSKLYAGEQESLITLEETKQIEEDVVQDYDEAILEMEKLYRDLDELQNKLSKAQEEKIKLEKELHGFREKEAQDKFKKQKLEELKKLVRVSVVKNNYDNINYKNAIDNISKDNLQEAQNLLLKVSTTSLNNYINSISSNISNNKNQDQQVQGNESLNEDKKTEEKEELSKNYQRLQNQTNMVLGYLELIKLDYSLAGRYFSKSFRESSHIQIIISSISNIIAIYDLQERKKEVCISIKALEASIDNAQQQTPELIIDSKYFNLITDLRDKYSCELSLQN